MANTAPPRPPKTPPTEPTTLAELEEAVRERLHLHGQHGAIALFGKYTAAVKAKLGDGLREELVTIASQLKTSEEITAEMDAAIEARRLSAKPAKGKKAK